MDPKILGPKEDLLRLDPHRSTLQFEMGEIHQDHTAVRQTGPPPKKEGFRWRGKVGDVAILCVWFDLDRVFPDSQTTATFWSQKRQALKN